ncbi:hypothetical protein X777_05934 [Ooceraea biroi]|uniref:Uncharacterized protein n=1 Tax=Ooceraea biroi TaxID=2015173 RepID=A0A026WDD3_OOCBI|nr:hypothetical protein X777_05934 [Ooceraea biroi]
MNVTGRVRRESPAPDKNVGFSLLSTKMKGYVEEKRQQGRHKEERDRKGVRVLAGVKTRVRVRVRGPARERPPGIRSIGCARARGGSRVSVTDYPVSNEHVSPQVLHRTQRRVVAHERNIPPRRSPCAGTLAGLLPVHLLPVRPSSPSR